MQLLQCLKKTLDFNTVDMSDIFIILKLSFGSFLSRQLQTFLKFFAPNKGGGMKMGQSLEISLGEQMRK